MKDFLSMEDILENVDDSIDVLMEELVLNAKIIETTRQQIDEILSNYSQSKIVQT